MQLTFHLMSGGIRHLLLDDPGVCPMIVGVHNRAGRIQPSRELTAIFAEGGPLQQTSKKKSSASSNAVIVRIRCS